MVLGALSETASTEGIYYYNWDGGKLVHVRTILSHKHNCDPF
jgi:hypothetical protein